MTFRGVCLRWGIPLVASVVVGIFALGVVGEMSFAKFRGTDVLSINAPSMSASTGNHGVYYNVYPWSSYMVDAYITQHGIAGLGSIEANTLALITRMIWAFALLLARIMLLLFEFAFTFDALSGPDGLLSTTSSAIQELYQSSAIQELIQIAVVIACAWCVVQIGRKQFALTLQGLGKLLVAVMIGFAVINYPQQTVGTVFGESNRLAAEVLESGRYGMIGRPSSVDRSLPASQRGIMGAADGLFRITVDAPWQVLQFGSLSHCAIVVGKDDVKKDADVPGGFGDKDRVGVSTGWFSACGKQKIQPEYAKYPLQVVGPISHQRYAKLMLSRQGDERKHVYEAIKDGRSSEESKDAGAKQPIPDFSAKDMPAADLMQEDAQWQRPIIAGLVFFGDFGVVLLIAGIAFSVVAAQIMAMVLLSLTPGAIVVGILPMAGTQQLFKKWGEYLLVFLMRKLVYALVLMGVLFVQGGMTGVLRMNTPEPQFGWLVAYLIQCTVFWVVVIKHRAIINAATRAITGRGKTQRRSWLAGSLEQGYYAGRMTDAVNKRAVLPVLGVAGAAAGGAAGGIGLLYKKLRSNQNDDIKDGASKPPSTDDGGGTTPSQHDDMPVGNHKESMSRGRDLPIGAYPEIEYQYGHDTSRGVPAVNDTPYLEGTTLEIPAQQRIPLSNQDTQQHPGLSHQDTPLHEKSDRKPEGFQDGSGRSDPVKLEPDRSSAPDLPDVDEGRRLDIPTVGTTPEATPNTPQENVSDHLPGKTEKEAARQRLLSALNQTNTSNTSASNNPRSDEK